MSLVDGHDSGFGYVVRVDHSRLNNVFVDKS